MLGQRLQRWLNIDWSNSGSISGQQVHLPNTGTMLVQHWIHLCWWRSHCSPIKHEMLSQCSFNVGPSSLDSGTTLKQHWVNISCLLGAGSWSQSETTPGLIGISMDTNRTNRDPDSQLKWTKYYPTLVLLNSTSCYSILFYSILFYSILFYSILFYSILFYSILFYSILFYSILFYFSVLFCSVLFCSVLFCSVLLCSVLFCSVLFCSVLFCSVLFCSLFSIFYSILF